jgi:hypothetical protein
LYPDSHLWRDDVEKDVIVLSGIIRGRILGIGFPVTGVVENIGVCARPIVVGGEKRKKRQSAEETG